MEIDLDAIEENYRRIRQFIGAERGIIGVVKANAYGLGAVPIARQLEGLGCDMLAVACVEEAMELRENGIRTPLLTLGPVAPAHARLAAENAIEMPVISLGQAQALSQAAVEAGVSLRVHIKTDVGLTRFGLVLKNNMEQAVEEALAIAALPGLSCVAAFSHYTGADVPLGEEFNLEQIGLFHTFCRRIGERGLQVKTHSASSLFTAIYPQCHDDYVRVAALLLGLEAPAPRGIACVPSAQLKTRIYQIKEVEAGTPVSYGPTYYTLRRTRVAVIPLGFADGLRRTIQNKVSLMVHGQWAKIIGKMCMDYMMLDVTDIPQAREGDEVTVFGRDGALHMESFELAGEYPGSVGELTSVLSPRIPRFYTRGGTIVARLDGALEG